MDTNLTNPPDKTASNFSSYFNTILLLAIVFLFSLVIAIHSQSIQKGTQRLEQKMTEKAGLNKDEDENNWVTYRNTILGYEIQYPPQYSIQENANNEVKISNSSEFDQNETALIITIKAINKEQFSSASNPQILSILNNIGYDQLAEKFNYYIAGNFLGDPPWGYYQIIITPENGRASSILFTARVHRNDQLSESERGTNGRMLNTAKQMLSTFEFLGSIDEQEGWQTYINSEYGFELEYPNDYFVSEMKQGGVMIADNKWKEGLVHHPAIYIQTYNTNLSIDELVQQRIDEKIDTGYETCTINCGMHSVSEKADEVFIGNNIRALRYKEWGVSGGNTYTIVKENPNMIIEISDHMAGSRAPGETSVPRNILDQILSSFRFTK